MIYLFLARPVGLCKIGYSCAPQERFLTVSACSPVELELYGAREGGLRTERHLHEKLKQYRVRYEWFSFNDDVVEAFENQRNIDGEDKNAAARARRYVRADYKGGF